jgi:hypothetical protein
MKKRRIVYIVVFVLVAMLATGLSFRDVIIPAILSQDFAPREPENQVKTTNSIGWWAYQKTLTVGKLSVAVTDGKLNLFNSYSLISYSVAGRLKGNPSWKPYIGAVHISQRFLRMYDRERHPYLDKDTATIPEAIVEITPVVMVAEDKSYKGEPVSFSFTNELKLQSFHYGNNWIRFKCHSLQKDITLRQVK